MAKRSLQPITPGIAARRRALLALVALALATAAGFAPGPLGRVAAQVADRPTSTPPARSTRASRTSWPASPSRRRSASSTPTASSAPAASSGSACPTCGPPTGRRACARRWASTRGSRPAGRTTSRPRCRSAWPSPSTWDPELAEAYGRVVGDEARARGKHVILGPALNIQRTPLCGRTYDYFGEDPWLAGRMTVGYVKGMQAEQTIACIKHFALNNQEKDRGTIDVQVDERPLREIYLPAFEAGVREGGALAVMGAYNKLRGQHAGHHEYLLNQVLKREWGFTGAVISDWGGTHDTREAVAERPRPRDGHEQALRPVLPGRPLPGRAEGRHLPGLRARRQGAPQPAHADRVGRARRPPPGHDQHEGAPGRGPPRRAGRDRPAQERALRPAARPREAEDDRGDRRQRRAPFRRGRQRGRREGLPRDHGARRHPGAGGRPGRRRLLAGLPAARAPRLRPARRGRRAHERADRGVPGGGEGARRPRRRDRAPAPTPSSSSAASRTSRAPTTRASTAATSRSPRTRTSSSRASSRRTRARPWC